MGKRGSTMEPRCWPMSKHRGGNGERFHDGTARLMDVGVTKIQSHRWQQVAAVPEFEFDYVRSAMRRMAARSQPPA